MSSPVSVEPASPTPSTVCNVDPKVEADNRSAFYAQLKAQLAVLHGLLGKVAAGTGWGPSAIPQANSEELAKEVVAWIERLSHVDADAPPISTGPLLILLRVHVLEHANPLSVGNATSDGGRLLLTCHTVAHLCAVRCTSVLKYRLPQLDSAGSVAALADAVDCLSVAIHSLVTYCPIPPSPVAYASLPPGSPMMAVMRLVFKFCTDFLKEYVVVARIASQVMFSMASVYLSDKGDKIPATSLREVDNASAAIACTPADVGFMLKGISEPIKCTGVLSSISNLDRLPIGFLLQCVSALGVGTSASLPSSQDAKQGVNSSGPQRTVADATQVLFQFIGALGRITPQGELHHGLARTQSIDSFAAALSPLTPQGPVIPKVSEAVAALAEMTALRTIQHPLVVTLAVVVERVSEASEGGRLALRLLEDLLKGWGAQTMRKVMALPEIGKAVAEALLPCLASTSKAMLTSALACTGTLLTKAPGEVAQELAPLYCSCLFKAMRTPSVYQIPDSHRLVLVEHFTSTFVLPTIDGTSHHSTHLVRLYGLFDLSPSLFEADLIQGFVNTISTIVNDESERRAQQAGDGKFTPPVTPMAKASYRALSQLLQTLASCVLRESEEPCDIEVAARISNTRGNKMDLLTELSKINEHPVKSLKVKFSITADEYSQGHNTASDEKDQASLECKDVPPCPPELLPKVNAIVDFLNNTPALAPSVLSEFLSDNNFFPLQCCREFMRRLSFEGMSLAEALCEMLGNVGLAREGQRIERQLEFFTEAFYNANKDLSGPNFPFKSMDALYVVVVAVVMLNTDLHNPRVTSKMNPTNFAGQLKGCNDGENFPDGFAASLYEQIKNKPLSKSKAPTTSEPSAPKQPGSLFFNSYEDPVAQAGLQARQLLVHEAKELLHRKGPAAYSDEGVSNRAVGAEVAKDLFVAVWHSAVENLCVGLASGSYDGDVASDCILGLRSALACASAFYLPTECDAIFEKLVHFMRTKKGLAGSCAKAILGVSSSPAALVHFTVKAWRMLVWVLVEVGKSSQVLVDQTDELTWKAVEELVNQVESQGSGYRETREGAAVVRMFEGLSLAIFSVVAQDAQTFKGCCTAIRKAATFPYVSSSGKRVLGASSYALGEWLHPTIVRLATIHSASDELLQIITEMVCSILIDSWRAAHTSAYSQANQPVCHFGLLRSLFDSAKCAVDVTGKAKAVVASPRVKLHVVEGIRALGQQLLSNPKLARGTADAVDYEVATWTVLAQLLAKSMYENETVGSEVCTVAAGTVRSLITAAADATTLYMSSAVPSLVSTILARLSDAAFLGALCADLSTARVCVPQLVTVATSSLNSPTNSLQRDGPVRKPTDTGEVAMHAMRSLVLLLRSEKNAIRDDAITAFKQVLVQLHEREVVSCAALVSELLVATMRSDLSEQANSPMYHHLSTTHDATVRSPPVSPTAASSSVDDEYASRFVALGLTQLAGEVPCGPTEFDRKVIRRASKVAFYTSLPAVLELLLRDLLRSNLPDASQAEVASHIASSCLLPAVLLNPSTTSITSRTLCARYLMDALSLCKGSTPRPRRWALELAKDATEGRTFVPSSTILSTVAFLESAVRVEAGCASTVETVAAFDACVSETLRGWGLVPPLENVPTESQREAFVAISSVVLGGLPAVLSATTDDAMPPTPSDSINELLVLPAVGPNLFAEVLGECLTHCQGLSCSGDESRPRSQSVPSAAFCTKGAYLSLLDMAIRWHQPDLLYTTTRRLFTNLALAVSTVVGSESPATNGSAKGIKQHPMYALLHSVDVCAVAWWEFVSAALDEVTTPAEKRADLWSVLSRADIFELVVRSMPTNPLEAAIAARTPAIQQYLLEFGRRQL